MINLKEQMQIHMDNQDWEAMASLIESMKNNQAKVTSKKKRGRPKKSETKPIDIPEDVGRKSKKPFGDGTNKFKDRMVDALVDLKTVPKDLDFDALAQSNAARPPVQFVNVKCARCGKEEEVHPDCAPRRIDKDHVMEYTCNKCCRIRR